jgi:hypothetical protein
MWAGKRIDPIGVAGGGIDDKQTFFGLGISPESKIFSDSLLTACNRQNQQRPIFRCPTPLIISKFGPTGIAKTSATLESNKN